MEGRAAGPIRLAWLNSICRTWVQWSVHEQVNAEARVRGQVCTLRKAAVPDTQGREGIRTEPIPGRTHERLPLSRILPHRAPAEGGADREVVAGRSGGSQAAKGRSPRFSQFEVSAGRPANS